MGYKVVLEDGPAEGWGYVTSVPPDPVIAVAPMPHRPSGRFMRVLLDGYPWDGQREYARGELPDDSTIPDELGDVVVRYRVLDGSPSAA